MTNNAMSFSDRAEAIDENTHKMVGAVEALGLIAMRITELSEDGNTLTGRELHGLRFAVDAAREIVTSLIIGTEAMLKQAIACEKSKPEVPSVEGIGLKKGKRISELTDEEILDFVRLSDLSTPVERDLARRLGETLKANGQLEEDLEKMEEASQAA